MARKQELPNLKELMEVSRTSAPPEGSATEICPTDDDLNKFIAGHFAHNIPEQNRILKHLRGCARCTETLQRVGKPRHQAHRRRILFTAAAVAVVLIAAVIAWLIAFENTRRQQTPTVAVVDLRTMVPTRGPDVPVPVVPRDVQLLTIILPAGSEEGGYQVAVFDVAEQGGPLFLASVESHQLTLKTSVNFSHLRPQHYFLAVRHGKFSWQPYLFLLK